jgi:hypothetical protein
MPHGPPTHSVFLSGWSSNEHSPHSVPTDVELVRLITRRTGTHGNR